jgi:hypothetical protein
MAFIQDEVSPEERLYNQIDKVVIIRGILPTDPTVWEFHIADKILRVETDKLLSIVPFKQQYIKQFNHPCPFVNPKKWSRILEALSEDPGKMEYEQRSEESEQVFVARELFEKVCDLCVTDDPEAALVGNGMYEHDGFYYVTSAKITELLQATGFKMALNILSDAMTRLNLKKEGTTLIRYGGPQKRSWGFIKKAVNIQKRV